MQELAAIDISNSAVYFKPVGSAAQGAAMASATGGAGGGCSGCPSGEDGGGLAAVAAGPGGVAVAPPGALTQQRTPASPDALASYAYDLLVGADGAASTTSKGRRGGGRRLAPTLRPLAGWHAAAAAQHTLGIGLPACMCCPPVRARYPARPSACTAGTLPILRRPAPPRVPAGTVLQRYDTGLACRLTRDSMEFKTCVLGPAAYFLPPEKGGVGTFQTWSNAKVGALGGAARLGWWALATAACRQAWQEQGEGQQGLLSQAASCGRCRGMPAPVPGGGSGPAPPHCVSPGTWPPGPAPQLQATLIGSSTEDGQLRCVFILPGGVSQQRLGPSLLLALAAPRRRRLARSGGPCRAGQLTVLGPGL